MEKKVFGIDFTLSDFKIPEELFNKKSFSRGKLLK